MKHRYSRIIFSALLVSTQFAYADDATEMVITPNLVETPEREVANSITVISAAEMERTGVRTVSDALRTALGTDVVKSGGEGGNVAVFLRGANSEHTLVLIDGVVANNPVSTNRAYNFADLSLDDVEKIEILRGPQSTIYGSDAIGGVINIISKKGTKTPESTISLGGGSHATFNEHGSIRGRSDAIDYSVSASREDTSGISAANSRLGNGDSDGYGNTSIAGRVGINPSEIIDGAITLRVLDARADLDNDGGAFGDDPNRRLTNRELFSRGEVNLHLLDKKLTQSLFMNVSDHHLRDDNDPDLTNPSDSLRSVFDGVLYKFGLLNSFIASESVSFLLGAESSHERASSTYSSNSIYGPFDSNFDDRTATTNGYFLQNKLSLSDAFYSTFGVRVDQHSQFGHAVTWRVAPTYSIDCTGTKLSATAGTGFKAPSLYQLYSVYGLEDLQPERSLGVDGGIEQVLFSDSLKLGGTYFWNRLRNLVSFNPDSFKLENTAKARTQGAEVFVRYNMTEETSVNVGVTYTDTKDLTLGSSLLRRPRVKSSTSINYGEKDGLNLNLSIFGTSTKFDNDFSTFPASRSVLAGYGTVNLTGSYPVAEKTSVFVKLENLLDKNYEDVLGYGTNGVTVFGGVKVTL